MRNFMCNCQKTHNCEFYRSKIEKHTHFPQKVYRLSNPRSCDLEFRILISVQKMCPYNSIKDAGQEINVGCLNLIF